jgi:DNA-binding NarL/FixJ family response regulator
MRGSTLGETMSKVRILIADDHQVVRQGLITTLESDEFEVVGEAVDGVEAIQMAGTLQPDVILIDVQMPKMDGIEATKEITRRFPGIYVVVLSSFDQDEYIYKCIQAGAKGYVLKGDSLDGLLQVLRAAAKGESLLPPHIATKLVERISAPPADHRLTEREMEVLGLLGQGLRNKEIGVQLHITERTVKNHVARIIAKLGVKSRTEAVSLAVKENLIDLN